MNFSMRRVGGDKDYQEATLTVDGTTVNFSMPHFNSKEQFKELLDLAFLILDSCINQTEEVGKDFIYSQIKERY